MLLLLHDKKGYIAEAIGTFSLVFCGTGVIVINEFTGATMTHMGIAMTFGLIVMGMIVAFGEKSGGHYWFRLRYKNSVERSSGLLYFANSWCIRGGWDPFIPFS